MHIRPAPALTAVKPEPFAARSFFERLAGYALPSWETLEREIAVSHVARGGSIFAQDDAHPFVYVVRSGLIKNVYFDDDGGDWIKSFCAEGLFFASVAALAPGGRTSFAAIAVEPSVIERFPYATLEQLAGQHLAWATAVRRALLIYGQRKEKRERELLTLRPEQRYRAFIEDAPELESRIPQRDLARYLGLTPVGLNRIVRRVRRA